MVVEVEEEREFEGARAADGEGFDDELGAEFDAFDIGARFEGDIRAAAVAGFCCRLVVVVWVLVLLLLVAAAPAFLLFLFLFFSLLHCWWFLLRGGFLVCWFWVESGDFRG